MSFLFWFFLAALFYVYLGYPVLVWTGSLLFARKVHKEPLQPKVSILISAFNEAEHIERRILDLLSQNYPEDKLEILIGSDGSSDETDAIVAKFSSSRVRLFRFVKNQGKPRVLNALVPEAMGSILVFADSRQTFRRDAVQALVDNFSDPQVGCVSGELFFEDSEKKAVGKGMDAYWRYEKFLRKCESQLSSMLGATGAIYAIRKELFQELPSDMLVDDMYTPLSIVQQGFRALFEPRAQAFDRVSEKGTQEFKRKVRTLAGNYQIFQTFPGLLNPFKSPVAWQLFSHKFLRLMVPFFLLGLFAVNLFLLDTVFYQVVFVLQVLFYGIALFESTRERKKGVAFIPYTFCLLNYSAFVAFVHYFSGKYKVSWEKAYA